MLFYILFANVNVMSGSQEKHYDVIVELRILISLCYLRSQQISYLTSYSYRAKY